MVERVARALFARSAPYVEGCCNDPDYDKCHDCRRDALWHASVAIEAMRQELRPEIVEELDRAAIDAALQPPALTNVGMRDTE